MNFKNITTIAGLATGAAIALTAASAQAADFTNGTVEGTFLGFECETKCVDLGAAGYTTSGGALIDPASDSKFHLTPGSDDELVGIDTIDDSDNVKSYNITSSASKPAGAETPLEVFGLDGVFDFFWGSVDTYNVITFKDALDNTVGVFTGDDLAGALGLGAGDQTGAGNYNFDAYVSFTGDFTKATLTSSNIAFEVAAAVPEPASILGLAMVGLIGGSVVKRRSQEA